MYYLGILLISVLMNGCSILSVPPPPTTYKINVTNNGVVSYKLEGIFPGMAESTQHMRVIVNVGDTVEFTVNAPGHPFNINTINTTGIENRVTTPPATGQGVDYGIVSWTPNTVGVQLTIP